MITTALYAIGFVLIVLGVLAAVALIHIATAGATTLIVIGVVLMLLAWFLTNGRRSAV